MHREFSCPHDGERLVRVKPRLGETRRPRGVFWTCRTCKGRWTSLPFLRKFVGDRITGRLWRSSKGAAESQRQCATCQYKLLASFPVEGSPEVDICRRCHMVWFDPDEFETLLEQVPPAKKPLSPEVVEAMALFEAESRTRRRKYERPSAEDRFPDTWWKYVPAAFGFPVEEGAVVVGRPIATWLVGALMVLAFFFTLGREDFVYAAFGLIPDQWSHGLGIKMITSFFVHAGILHLLGNLWFLLMFGDNVEEEIGTARTLLLLLVATVIGDVCHVLWDPSSDVPVVGASGGISGIIAYYGLRFPHVRIFVAIRFIFFLQMKARTAMWVWLAIQVFGALMQVSAGSDVSSLAHLGGAAAGVLAFLVWRDGRAGR